MAKMPDWERVDMRVMYDALTKAGFRARMNSHEELSKMCRGAMHTTAKDEVLAEIKYRRPDAFEKPQKVYDLPH